MNSANGSAVISRLTVITIATVSFLTCLHSLGAAKTPAQILEENQAALTLITHNKGFGSGFLYQQYLITNYHVVQGSRQITVKLGDRELQLDSVFAHSQDHDLAIFRVSGNFPSVTLGDSSLVKPGVEVVVIGNPQGLEKTVSNGLVSGVRQESGTTLLQISAPISPGSSGGPVFDLDGKVIGVAFATLEGGQNLNFAIPINYAKKLLESPNPASLSSLSRSREPQALTVYVTRTGTKYHSEGCRYFRRSKIPIELKDAARR